MRTVEVQRTISRGPSAVERALDPPTIVEYEGSFDVFDVEERDEDWRVVAGGTVLRLTLRFEERERGYYYEQEETEGQPLETMETTLTYESADGGTLVTATSTVSAGLPPRAIADRIAAWKRAGELVRALERLETDLAD